jgi:hypothetical protein
MIVKIIASGDIARHGADQPALLKAIFALKRTLGKFTARAAVAAPSWSVADFRGFQICKPCRSITQ